jgi:radical SAM superfamily enzyme YgiQ (UPF0313 family)
MKVLLISANTEKTNSVPLPLGLACVGAACERAGHEVRLLNLMFQGETEAAVREAIAGFGPDVIGISVRNIDDQNMANPRFLLPPVREVVAICRNLSRAPIVLGGPGYSIFPESALRYLGADMGLQGEGETGLLSLLERLESGVAPQGLPGLYLPGRVAASPTWAPRLEDLPLPRPELWIPVVPGRAQLWIPVQGKRGCPLDCSFCATRYIEGRKIRMRAAEAVVDWLEELAGQGFRNFVFVDSTFNLPPAYAKALCGAIRRRGVGLNFWCIVYPKGVDRELVDLMAAAGCRQVSLGFESGAAPVLVGFNKRFGADEVRTAAAMFAEAGIERTGFLMLGGPGETKETTEESLAFADSLKLEALKVTVGLRIYPRTALAATARAEGIVGPDDDLLRPAFYAAPALKDWLPQRAAEYRRTRPWVT